MEKSELRKIIHLDDRINSKLRQLDQLRQTMYSIGSIDYSKDRIDTGPTSSIENTVIKVTDYQEEINKDIDNLIDLKVKASKKIGQVEGAEGNVLEMRYLECMDWGEISYRLNYSVSYVYQLHGRGLELIKNIVNSSK